MRQVQDKQMKLGETDISDIVFDPKSRDDIPPLLMGLQHIYMNEKLRKEVFAILETIVPEEVDLDQGRPGMELWKIFVMGTLRHNLNWDYDRLLEMVNNHKIIRQMLGHGLVDDEYRYNLQTLKDNVRLFTPEALGKINRLVVEAGHFLVKENEDEKLRGRCDSFVVETDVHYPTDINLLFDATRKVIQLIALLCAMFGLTEWRQSASQIRRLKKLFRDAQKIKHSSSKDEEKKEQQKARIVAAHEAYIEKARDLVDKAKLTLVYIASAYDLFPWQVDEIMGFIAHAERQIDQIKRRVVHGEKIPHSEKVFSVFQEHTEWIKKGKAGVPVELGLRVCILEDQYGFILHHQVIQKQTDDKVAVSMVDETQAQFSDLRVCSFDKGFWSPANRTELEKRLDLLVLPKKGKLSLKDQAAQQSDEFIRSRRQHSAVESGINALEVHGLDRCLDHGIDGFRRYVAMAVVARNIQKLGAILHAQLREKTKRKPAAHEAA